MGELTKEVMNSIVEQCRESRKAICDSLNASLATKFDLQIGKARDFTVLDSFPDGPGLAVTFVVGGAGVICLIPESLPIPRWYREPNESQTSRLQTLSMEWSAGMFPPEVEVEEFATVPTENLRKHVEKSRPAQDATVFELNIADSMTGQVRCTLFLIGPVHVPVLKPDDNWNRKPEDDERARAEQASKRPLTTSDKHAGRRRSRLKNVPVQLVVRIADKRIDVRQLRNISPGTLLTFNRSCESPLDVYIGNHLYCRGEAVKVGENFGIKINEVEAKVMREKRIHRL